MHTWRIYRLSVAAGNVSVISVKPLKQYHKSSFVAAQMFATKILTGILQENRYIFMVYTI